MHKFTLWGSTDGFTEFIKKNTLLKNQNVEYRYLPESDASKPKTFHRLPTHIKNIQYLDSPDLIIELNGEPILTVEISREAGTGHNVFQRFARIAAAVENDVPCIYIYPEAVLVYRENSDKGKWDVINPLIFYALEKLSRIYANTPALMYYYPSSYNEPESNRNLANKGLKLQKNTDDPVVDSEMKEMFSCINEIIQYHIKGKRTPISAEKHVSNRLSFMQSEYIKKGGTYIPTASPISATIKVPSSSVIKYISSVKNGISQNKLQEYFNKTIWSDRKETIIYKVNSKFRGDPYPGCLAALDYILTRRGKTYEDREYNLVIAWGDVSYDEITNTLNIVSKKEKQSINTLFSEVKKNDIKQDILLSSYKEIEFEQLPRYFMQLRFGSTFSKPKHIRVYSYFADAILFFDGALWREG